MAVTRADITEILDGNQVFIDNQQARVGTTAAQGQQVRTERARAELRFNTGAVGRLAQNSSLVVGRDCVRVNRGTLLVSGASRSCGPQVLLGVRGTVYTLAVEADGTTVVTVLEGSLELTVTDPALISQAEILHHSSPLAKAACQTPPKGLEKQAVPCSAIPLQAGLQISVDPQGQIQSLRPLSQAEFEAVLQSPLMQGFSQPLPQQNDLQRSFEQLYPGSRFPALDAATPSPETTTDATCQQRISQYRQDIRALADAAWLPPQPPSKGVWAVRLGYDVTRNGSVENIQVLAPSGNRPFDESAIASAENIQFPPLPDCFTGETLDVTHLYQLVYE